MAKVLVLYYSAYGHIEKMANAVAEGARKAGAPSTSSACRSWCPRRPPNVALQARSGRAVAKIDELADYDAIIYRHGHALRPHGVQMANFLDQAGGLWAKGALVGKVGGAFTSTATQHGGQETTLFSIITNLLHLGMMIVGLPYASPGQMRRDHRRHALRRHHHRRRRRQRQPSETELDGARYLGRRIAETAAKLITKS